MDAIKFPNEWKVYELGQMLDYEQPTPYIVESTDYNDNFQTPVLTAGKSFIIGHTNETTGVYDKLPVIIFDDFTTSSQFVHFKFKVKSSAMKILTANETLALPKFLFYLMQIIDCDHGTHKRYWISIYSKIKVSLPPISEQQRIIFKIEELFSELDKGVSEMQKVKEQLKVYRQAVLKEAFEQVPSETVENHSIQAICENIVDCPHSTPKWTSSGMICLRTTNFRRGYLDLSQKNYVSQDTYNERIARLKPQYGDVLYSREGAILGIACMISSEINVCLGQRMMLMRPTSKARSKFLMYYLNSPIVTTYIKGITGGSASPHINVGDIKKFSIPIPTLEMQDCIILGIESRLSVCDKIEQIVEESLKRAEHLQQSILKQAFEGKLVRSE